MDDGDATHEAMGTLGSRSDPGFALERGCACDASFGDWCSVCWHVSLFPTGDDVADWNLGAQPERALEEDAADCRMGRHGVRDLAAYVWAQEYPMAKC